MNVKVNKVAIITGGSRGIGAAIARTLARENYAVCVNYHESAEKAQQVVDEIVKNKGHAIAVKANMALESDIISLFETVDHTLGPVSALVNNAGCNGGISVVEDVTADLLQSVFAVNVFATFLCSREAVKRMKKMGSGSIVNISSEAARFGGNKLAHYAAAKAAVNTFTIGFAREVAANNIRVNAVSPGVIETEIHQGSPADRIQALKNSIPMGRMGSPEEVAETVCWLLSEKASYLSGAVVSVTGGR